ncbi:MAG: hypothetical protein ACP5TK_00105 [Candidatus Micrarchaeia archaeon]
MPKVKDVFASNMAVMSDIENAIEDKNFSEYVSKNIGKNTIEIMKELATPRTDDYIADKLSIKINEVRRILNMLNSYGIARYISNKNSKGWLMFKWYIDAGNLSSVKEALIKKTSGFDVLDTNCNDFFICKKCFNDQKLVFSFETASEMNFRCECGEMLTRLDRSEAEALLSTAAVAEKAKH